MQIGSVIRKYRLQKNLTQEEMARRLGVTAPAVNKWEKGRSMPDITLLSPLARLLGVTLEELLSHADSLPNKEAEKIILAAHKKLESEPFASVFAWAREQLQIYPNSAYLALYMARVLHSHLEMQEDGAEQEYEAYFVDCYQRALESEDESVKSAAADALYYHYMGCGRFDKAEEYLDYFSTENPERKRKLAAVYRETGRKEDAQCMYGELLYAGYQSIQSTFQDIYYTAMKDEDFEKAHQMVEKQRLLARTFEMGAYHEVSPGLDLAILEQDADKLFAIMQCLVNNIESIYGFTSSPLYSGMKLKQPDPQAEYLDKVRQSLRDCLQDESCAFVRGDARFEALFE